MQAFRQLFLSNAHKIKHKDFKWNFLCEKRLKVALYDRQYAIVSCQVTKQRSSKRERCCHWASLLQLYLQKKYCFFMTKLSQWVFTRFRLTFSCKCFAKRMYAGNCAAFITSLLRHKDNCYANYLTDTWISSFDPCISRGQIFGLIFSSWKINLYTGNYGSYAFTVVKFVY